MRYHYFLILLLLGGCWATKGSELPLQRNEKHQNLDTIMETLNDILAQESSSYQRFIWRAYHLTQKYCIGQKWAEIESSLKRHGADCTKSVETRNHTVSLRRYKIKKDVYFTKVKYPLDIYMKFWVDRKGLSYDTLDIEACNVIDVEVGLEAEVNKTYEMIMEQQVYPLRSAIYRALELDETRFLAHQYRVLKNVEICYEVPQDGWEWYHRYVFVIELFLGPEDAKNTEVIGVYKSFIIESGLDPVEYCSDNKSDEDFIPEDTLGKISPCGESTELKWYPDK